MVKIWIYISKLVQIKYKVFWLFKT